MTEEQKKIKRYVNAIEWHLKVPLEMKARINSDIGTEIHLRLEAGKTIDEVIAEMGTPKEVAQRFNTELKEQTLRKHPLRFLFLTLSVLVVIGTVAGGMNHFLPLSQEEISMIVGADGPTSVYVKDAFGGRNMGYWISGIGLCLGCIGAYLLLLYGKQAAPKGCKSSMILSGIGFLMNFVFVIVGMLQWGFSSGISTIEIALGFVLNLVVFLIAALRLKKITDDTKL